MIKFFKKWFNQWAIKQHQNHYDTKKTSFFIWGCNPFSSYLYNKILSQYNHIEILGFIDDQDIDFFCNKRVYSPQEFKKIELTDFPLIIASHHDMRYGRPNVNFESIYQFKSTIQRINNEFEIKNHLLHPAALIDFVFVSYPNKIIQFGLPGSGITFLSHICAKIIEINKRHFETKNEVNLFFEKMCYEYTQCMQQLFSDAAHFAGGFDFHMASWKIGMTSAIYSLSDARLEIYSLPTRNHVIGPVYNYHHIPGINYLKKLHQQKYKMFFSMRNPLDIILSCINKMSGVDKASGAIDMNIFCSASRWVIQQLDTWLSSSVLDNLSHFSYDHFIENPIKEIKSIMKHLGVTPSSRVARKIWKQLSFKQLSNAPKSHFWFGGSGKWEKYFKKEHISFLMAQGIEDILERCGYHDVLLKFKQHSVGVSPLEWQANCSKDLIEKMHAPILTLYKDETQDVSAFLKNFHGESNCLAGDYFYVAGNDSELTLKIKNQLNNKYVNSMILAGAHQEHRIM